MSIELEERFVRQVRDILQKHVPNSEVWVFGSRIGHRAKPFSDLDLAIVSPDGLTPRQLALLASDFEESDLPIKVDLVDWQSAEPSFRDRIFRNHKVFFRPEKTLRPKS